MKNTITQFLSVLLIAVLTSCGNTTGGTNYYAKAGMVTPSLGDEEVDTHLKSFETLYNQLSTSVEANDKDANNLNKLSLAYSDWILKAMELKEKLPADKQKTLNDFVERTNKPWNVQKDKLF